MCRTTVSRLLLTAACPHCSSSILQHSHPSCSPFVISEFSNSPADGHLERRKAWIYEVPLVETHALRSQINRAHMTTEHLKATIKQFNVPVIAGTVKLYLLELNPPVMGWEGWEDAKAVYPQSELSDQYVRLSSSRSQLAPIRNVI